MRTSKEKLTVPCELTATYPTTSHAGRQTECPGGQSAVLS